MQKRATNNKMDPKATDLLSQGEEFLSQQSLMLIPQPRLQQNKNHQIYVDIYR
jgi:hypothetical protein